jgi:hypothetical protein
MRYRAGTATGLDSLKRIFLSYGFHFFKAMPHPYGRDMRSAKSDYALHRNTIRQKVKLKFGPDSEPWGEWKFGHNRKAKDGFGRLWREK